MFNPGCLPIPIQLAVESADSALVSADSSDNPAKMGGEYGP